MTWVYLPKLPFTLAAPVDALPASGLSATGSSATSKSTPTGRKSSKRESLTGSLTTPLSGTMLQVSTGDPGADAWIASQAAFPAPLGVPPVSAEGLPMPETSGPIPSESFARFDPVSRFWRTCHLSFDSPTFGMKFSGDWPRQGMMRAGACFPLRRLGRHIYVRGCSYLPTPVVSNGGFNQSASPGSAIRPSLRMMARTGLWPTPRANERHQYNSQDNGMSLSRAVAFWPTPQANDYRGANPNNQGKRVNSDHNLPTAVALWPTPKASRRGDCPAERERRSPSLEAAVSMWPTPQARDWRSGQTKSCYGNARPLNELVLLPTPTVSGNNNRKGASAKSGDGLATAIKTTTTQGQLNPAFVEWLMGWPQGWTRIHGSKSGPTRQERSVDALTEDTDLKPLETGKFLSAWLMPMRLSLRRLLGTDQ